MQQYGQACYDNASFPVMGIGPVASTRKVMAKTGMKIEDFDIIEANEAFAAQSVAVGKDLGIDVDKNASNPEPFSLSHIHVSVLSPQSSRWWSSPCRRRCTG